MTGDSSRLEAAAEVRRGRGREQVIDPERQHRHALPAQRFDRLDDAHGLACAGRSGQDGLAGGSLQSCCQLRGRLARPHRSLDEPLPCSVQVPVCRRGHRAGGVARIVQPPRAVAAPGESFDELPVGERALRRVRQDGEQRDPHAVGIGHEERLQPPPHAALEVPFAGRPNVDPLQAVEGGGSFAGPAPPESRETLSPDASGQPATLERRGVLRFARRTAQLAQFGRVAAGYEHGPIVVAGQRVADGLQQQTCTGIERGQTPYVARKAAPHSMPLPACVDRHDQIRPTGLQNLDAERFGGAVEQAHALGERPPLLVAGAARIRGPVPSSHGAKRLRAIPNRYTWRWPAIRSGCSSETPRRSWPVRCRDEP